jgi:ATP-dependent Clp protease ATP-binding subunit ClpC
MTEVTTVYDRFTTQAKRAMVAARETAVFFGHDFIGTEHLLVGLSQLAGPAGEGLRAHGADLAAVRSEVARQMTARGVATTHGAAAIDALAALGLDVSEIRRRAEASFGAGSLRFPRPSFSLSAKQTVKAALDQARTFGSEKIDAEHLLLAILAAEDDPAVHVLTALQIDLPALRLAMVNRASAD